MEINCFIVIARDSADLYISDQVTPLSALAKVIYVEKVQPSHDFLLQYLRFVVRRAAAKGIPHLQVCLLPDCDIGNEPSENHWREIIHFAPPIEALPLLRYKCIIIRAKFHAYLRLRRANVPWYKGCPWDLSLLDSD